MNICHRLQGCSMRIKLTLAMVVTSCLGLAISGAAFFWYGALSAKADLQREISTTTDVVAAHSTAALAFSDARAADHRRRSAGRIRQDTGGIWRAHVLEYS
jgi:hypothetical protein